MADLTYTIETVAELKGAQAQQAALEKQIGAAKALGKDYAQLQTQLDAVNNSLKNAKVPIDEAAEATEKLNEQKHGLIANLKALRHVHIPGLGEALHLLRHPITIIAVTIGLLVEKFREIIKEAEEMEKAMAGFANITTNLRNLRVEAQTAKADMAALATTLHNQAEDSQRASLGFAAMNSALEKQATLQGELVKAEAEAKKARIRLNTPEGPQQEAALMDVDIATGKSTVRDKQILRRKLLENKKDEIWQNWAEREQAQKQFGVADEAAIAAKLEASAASQAATATAGASDKELERLEKKKSAFSGPAVAIGSEAFPGGGFQSVISQEEIDQQLEQIEKDIERAKEQKKEAEAIAERKKRAAETANKRAERFSSQSEEANKKLLENQRKLAEMESEGDIAKGFEEQIKTVTEQAKHSELQLKLREEVKKAVAKRASAVREIPNAAKGQGSKSVADLKNEIQEADDAIHSAFALNSGMSREQVAESLRTGVPPGTTNRVTSPPKLFDNARYLAPGGGPNDGFGPQVAPEFKLIVNEVGDAIVGAFKEVLGKVNAARRSNDQNF